MTYCHCEAVAYHFDKAFAEAKLNHYTQKGLPIATRILVELPALLLCLDFR